MHLRPLNSETTGIPDRGTWGNVNREESGIGTCIAPVLPSSRTCMERHQEKQEPATPDN
jgi:hypothetical protein